MIKFFRKIRQNMIKESKVSKYMLYAIGEIVLVVIGILIALQINNWNEVRKQKALELDILKELKEGLLTDLEDATYNLKSQKNKYESQNIIINWLESDLAFNDSLSKRFKVISYASFFGSKEGSYQTLKQLGMRTIKNDSLRKQIIKLYELTYKGYHQANDYYEEKIEYLYIGYSKYLNEISLVEINIKPIDIVGLKKDNEFLFHLKTLRNFNNSLIEFAIPEVIFDINKTLTMIDNELEKNQ